MKDMNIDYKTFRKIIHKPFYENWLTEIIFRPISNYIVYYLMSFNIIKANHITSFSLVVTIFWSVFIFYWSYSWNFLLVICWSFLYVLFHLFDVVDWDLARARIKILWETPTLNGAYYDALIHQYYNFLFFSSYWYFLSKVFGNYIFLILWILAWFLLVVNDIIFLYKDIIKLTKKLKIKNLNYRNFKNKSIKKFTFKDFVVSFVWMMGFSIIFFVLLILGYFLENFFLLFYFFILLVLVIIFLHVKTFVDFLKFK